MTCLSKMAASAAIQDDELSEGHRVMEFEEFGTDSTDISTVSALLLFLKSSDFENEKESAV